MYIDSLSENEIITNIKVIKEGTQIGYGPATEFMSEDSFIIYLNNENRRISPYTIPIDQIDNVRDMIETSHKNEIDFYNRQNSMKSVFDGDVELMDYLNLKFKSVQGNDFISDLELKYQNLTDSVNNAYEKKQKREQNISNETGNSLEDVNNSFHEQREELLDEIKKEIESPVNSKNARPDLEHIPEHLKEEHGKIFDDISDEIKDSINDKPTIKKDNRYKPSIYDKYK